MSSKLISKRVKEKSKLSKEEWREYTKTVWQIANVSDKEHPAVFPIEIPRRLIKLFSFFGETVLDPFAGMGTTGIAALETGRKIILVEQNEDYVSEMRKRLGVLDGKPEYRQILCGDSRCLSEVDDNSVKLIVTSPPYWDKAKYGGNGENIGKRSSYTLFLKNLEKVFQECIRVLEPGRKICIVTANVNQHTDFGLLTFPLAADMTQLLRGIGLVMITEILWSKDGTGGKWGSANSQRPIFGSYPYPPNFLFKNVHEHILIFAKPNGKRVKGPKVRMLSEIMANS